MMFQKRAFETLDAIRTGLLCHVVEEAGGGPLRDTPREHSPSTSITGIPYYHQGIAGKSMRIDGWVTTTFDLIS